MALFYYVLQSNPQLVADFAKLVDSIQDKEEKSFGVTILHELGEQQFALLSKESQSLWNPKLAGVFNVSKVTVPWQLDVLWSEFFATGKKAPLEKIAAEVNQMQGNLSPDAYKKLKQPTQQDRESLMRFMNGMSAAWSLASNIKQQELVAFYMEAMLKRGEIKDDFTSKLVAEALNNASQSQKPVQPK